MVVVLTLSSDVSFRFSIIKKEVNLRESVFLRISMGGLGMGYIILDRVVWGGGLFFSRTGNQSTVPKVFLFDRIKV